MDRSVYVFLVYRFVFWFSPNSSISLFIYITLDTQRTNAQLFFSLFPLNKKERVRKRRKNNRKEANLRRKCEKVVKHSDDRNKGCPFFKFTFAFGQERAIRVAIMNFFLPPKHQQQQTKVNGELEWVWGLMYRTLCARWNIYYILYRIKRRRKSGLQSLEKENRRANPMRIVAGKIEKIKTNFSHWVHRDESKRETVTQTTNKTYIFFLE